MYIKKISIKKSMLLWIAGVTIGCQKHHQLQMWKGQPESLEGIKNVSRATGRSNHGQNQYNKCNILVLHGLLEDSNSLKPFVEKLENKLKSEGISDPSFIFPTSREEFSTAQGIAAQAENVFEEIKRKVNGSSKLFIIGYSQGALVGAEFVRCYGNQFNIHGFIGINGTLRGAPAMNATCQQIKSFIDRSEEGLKSIAATTGSSVDKIKSSMDSKANILQGAKVVHGLASAVAGLGIFSSLFLEVKKHTQAADDMDLNSPYTCDLSAYLRSRSNTTPCLLVGSYCDDFRKLFNLRDDRGIEVLNRNFAAFLTGRPNGKHDTLVPLSSQLCRGDSWDNLSNIDDQIGSDGLEKKMHRNPVITTFILPETSHAERLVALDEDIVIQRGKCVLKSDQAIAAVAKFIKENHLW